MADIATSAPADSGETRRDFLYLAATGMGVVGAACVAWPLIDTLNPSAEVLALASTEVELATIAEGQREIGRAHVRTPVTNAQLLCRLLLENNKNSTTPHT